MKTKEEILKDQEVHQIHINGVVYEMVKFKQATQAMQLYSDEQNKELRERLDSINESLTNELTVREATIQRLTKEVEELKQLNQK